MHFWLVILFNCLNSVLQGGYYYILIFRGWNLYEYNESKYI
ncbi:hypothetical protein CNEO4_1020021 [Clostridium neonatale]|nr:hypothetical protein CNEO_900025 [Clostridium neonatale]CAI3552401.1 hypothetical protein CNEO4_1020021 [Clostridium neonatale]CAI3587918.1 hypothetical protein CNEO3_190020 [Clostridium neonatale]CAI3597015.1 hypothetical protein CNEO3_10150 [Clostridium neonatale]CAI3652691.1 hypothetical protein CNEO4_370015 [Clostridium neonatale]